MRFSTFLHCFSTHAGRSAQSPCKHTITTHARTHAQTVPAKEKQNNCKFVQIQTSMQAHTPTHTYLRHHNFTQAGILIVFSCVATPVDNLTWQLAYCGCGCCTPFFVVSATVLGGHRPRGRALRWRAITPAAPRRSSAVSPSRHPPSPPRPRPRPAFPPFRPARPQ